MSAMEALMQQNEQQKASKQTSDLAAEEKSSRKDYWLRPGIVVKIMNKKVRWSVVRWMVDRQLELQAALI